VQLKLTNGGDFGAEMWSRQRRPLPVAAKTQISERGKRRPQKPLKEAKTVEL
jgi:hypothetical protein